MVEEQMKQLGVEHTQLKVQYQYMADGYRKLSE